MGNDNTGATHISDSDSDAPANRLQIALGYFDAGLNVIPIKIDGTKAPALQAKHHFFERRATREEVTSWFGNNAKRGIGIPGGAVSDNLLVLDLDGAKHGLPTNEEFRELVEEHAPGLLDRLPLVETPSGGWHFYFRLPEIVKSKKLALLEREVAQGTKGVKERDGRFFKRETLIETKGDGGYVLAPGSPAKCHPTGKLYRILHGSLSNVPLISMDDWAVLHDCASSFNEVPDETKIVKAPFSQTGNAAGNRPGDDYDRSTSLEQTRAFLEKHGWTAGRSGSKGERWIRPGGERPSATLFADSGLFYVFSDSAEPFSQNGTYSPFALLVFLEYGGDFSAAAKALAAEGYGEQRKSRKARLALVGNEAEQVGESGDRDEGGDEAEEDLEIQIDELIDQAAGGNYSALKPENIMPLLRAQKDHPHLFARGKAALQNAGLKVTDINRALKTAGSQRRAKLSLVTSTNKRTVKSELGDDLPSPELGALLVPIKWKLTANSLQRCVVDENGNEEFVSVSHSPILIRSRCVNIEDDTQSFVVAWKSQKGWQEIAASRGTFLSAQKLIDLADKGFPVNSNRAKQIVDYLSDFEGINAEALDFRRVTPRLGWHGEGYVLPDETIGPNENAPYFQASGGISTLFNVRGTTDEWRERIGKLCVGNTWLTFAASLGFGSLLLNLSGGEGGGIHIGGNSSTGKTTSLYVAGSVMGGGADKGFLRSWKATGNALEGLALAHNDALLCLDEISEIDDRVIGEVVYMLSNGQGKSRMQRGGTVRDAASWRLLFFSSGELALAEKLARIGMTARGGQEVRLLTIPADMGAGMHTLETLHDHPSPDAFSKAIVTAAKECYGAPMRDFLRKVAADRDSLKPRIQGALRTFKNAHDLTNASGEVHRALDRFAIIAAGGELATVYGLTGWPMPTARYAASRLFLYWLAHRGGAGKQDENVALTQVRRFIEAHETSRFQSIGNRKRLASDRSEQDVPTPETRTIFNRAGYVRDGEAPRFFYFLPEVFRTEVCGELGSLTVLKALKDAGLLKTTSGTGNYYELRTGEKGKRRAYAVSEAIFTASVPTVPKAPESIGTLFGHG